MSVASFLNNLGGIASSGEKDDLAYYGQDTCHHFRSAASAVVFPQRIEEIVRCVELAREHGISLVPSGGRTGYSGGATATNGEVVLSLERLKKIIEVDPIAGTATVEAGVTIEALQQAARDQGLHYPVDFGSRGSAQVGGSIATNAGGIRVIRYGMTRQQVLGLTVVTGGGETLRLGGKLVKNNTGFDLMQLFIGSEGVLGVIADATLRLVSPPPPSLCACLALAQDSDPAALLAALRQAGAPVALFEFMDDIGVSYVERAHALTYPFAQRYAQLCLVELETPELTSREHGLKQLEALLESGLAQDIVVAESPQQRRNLFGLRELIGEVLNRTEVVHKNDIAVPLPQIQRTCQQVRAMISQELPEARLTLFGHVGDGNIHVNIIKPEALSAADFFSRCASLDTSIFAELQKVRGSVSAEHGVGLLKKPYLRFTRSAAEIDLMRELKAVFDPDQILNPGKIFDAASKKRGT